jgi:hypothetical protein
MKSNKEIKNLLGKVPLREPFNLQNYMRDYYQRNKERLKVYGRDYFKKHYVPTGKKGEGFGRKKRRSPIAIQMQREVCICGHSRLAHCRIAFNKFDVEYENPQIRFAEGHGACLNTYCDCKQFTFKEVKL